MLTISGGGVQLTQHNLGFGFHSCAHTHGSEKQLVCLCVFRDYSMITL